MAGIVDKERYVIDMSLSGKNMHLSTRLATERLSMTGLQDKLFIQSSFISIFSRSQGSRYNKVSL